jgi:hypothetical protein
MQPVSKFRGTSGEVVSQFVSPMTYVSALPIAIGLLLLNWICGHFGAYRDYLSLPITSGFLALAIMRFAIPASRGEMEPSNEPGEIMAYAGRYLLLNIAWYIPWVIIWKLLSKSSAPAASQLIANPMTFFESPLKLLIRVLLIIIALLLPTLCLLISLYSSTTKGLFSRFSWEWLLKQRGNDLAPFWSSLMGGGLVMILISFLPALVLVYIGFKGSSRTGMYVAVFLYVWIMSTIPVLNGRLAGTFVFDDFIQLDFVEDEPLVAVEAATTLQPVVPPRPPEAKPDMAEIEERMAVIDDPHLTTALEKAKELEMSLIAPLRGQIEQVILAHRLGNMDLTRSVAALAINAAAQRGFADISLKLFEKMAAADRRTLQLSAYSLEILGSVYQQKKQLLDAAWCLHASAIAAGDVIKAQKRLFQIAELAEKSGNNKDASTLYEILMKQYPNSTLMEFAQQGAERLKNQSV